MILAEFMFWKLPLPNDCNWLLKRVDDNYYTTRTIHYYCDVIIKLNGTKGLKFKAADSYIEIGSIVTNESNKDVVRFTFDARKQMIEINGSKFSYLRPTLNLKIETRESYS